MATGTLTRVERTASATLTHNFVVDETVTAVDASTDVTVAITDASGVSVATGTASASGGTYSYVLPGQSLLSVLSVDWTGTIGGTAVTERDYVEVVGGFFFDLLTARNSDSSLSDTAKFTTAQLRTARQEVEDECEYICDRAFVPRYRRAVLDGSGSPDIMLTDYEWAASGRSMADVRKVRSASIAPQVGQTFTPLTALQLASLVVTADGMIRRVDGGIWDEGIQNVAVELEYGWNAPPSDLVRMALVRLRDKLAIPNSGIPDRASSFTAVDGGTYRLDMPDAFKTGLPMVDAAYGRYSRRSGAGTGKGRNVPASRTLSYDPQTNSLFHTRL